MRTTTVILAFVLSCFGLAIGACGDDDEGTEPISNTHVATGDVEGIGEVEIDEAECAAFCEKANECARAEGRRIPEAVADCAASCRPGGVHRQAPPAIHACRHEECGPAFMECSRQAMLSHMRDRDVAVFPPICQGLCEKAARCHREAGEPPGPGEDDCNAACRVGGIYAEVPEREVLCVHAPCGPPFDACRAAGGPPAPNGPVAPPGAPNSPTSP